MQIDVGYFYFIKDSFFDIMDDPELMKNKESGNKRIAATLFIYFLNFYGILYKNGKLLWFFKIHMY